MATAVGPFVALTLVDGARYRALLLTSAGVSVAAAVVALALDVPEARLDAATRARALRPRPATLLEPSVVPISLVMFVMGASYGGVVSYLASFTAAEGLAGAASAFFAVYALAVLVSRPLAGRLQDRRGDDVTIVPAILALAAGLGVLGSAATDTAVLAAGVLMGAGYGTLLSSVLTAAVRITSPLRLGRGVSTLWAFVDGGTGLGPVLLGFVVTALGYRGMFLTSAAAVLGSVALYLVVHGAAGAGVRAWVRRRRAA